MSIGAMLASFCGYGITTLPDIVPAARMAFR